jgi:hypothetical protein
MVACAIGTSLHYTAALQYMAGRDAPRCRKRRAADSSTISSGPGCGSIGGGGGSSIGSDTGCGCGIGPGVGRPHRAWGRCTHILVDWFQPWGSVVLGRLCHRLWPRVACSASTAPRRAVACRRGVSATKCAGGVARLHASRITSRLIEAWTCLIEAWTCLIEAAHAERSPE